MNFKRYAYPFFVTTVLMISCSMDPFNVDPNMVPAGTKTFRDNRLQYMVPGYNGDYLACDGYRIFRMKPDSADEDGNIVHFLFQDLLDIRGLFYNDRHRICMVNNEGIYTFDNTYNLTTEVEFANDRQAIGLPVVSVDWNGLCRCCWWDGYNHYWIFQYSSGVEQVCVDEYTEISSPDLFFTSADNRYAVVYGVQYEGTWLRLYENDTLEMDLHLFMESDTARVENVFYVGDKLHLLCYLRNNVIVEIDGRTSLNLESGPHLITIDPNGIISDKTYSDSWMFPVSGPDIYYRSSKETWLWDSLSYCIATLDTIECHLFRETYFNKFNVLCFRDSSEVLFYDEVTQRFISTK
jgi:hypothetical protein